MDGLAYVGPVLQDQASHEAGHDAAAVAGTAMGRTADGRPDVAWLAVRAVCWASEDKPAGGDTGKPGTLALVLPPPLRGVTGLLFGVGEAGTGWLARLAGSGWFVGLEPQAEDLAVAGGVAKGRWIMPPGAAADRDRTTAATGAFFASAPLPNAAFASVAVARGAGPAEQSVALGLVGALRGRRGAWARRLAVVVTFEVTAGCARDEAFVEELLRLGAFVMRGGAALHGADGDHLHHAPLRWAVIPRAGRLICADLADFLTMWRPGRVSDLYAFPFSRGGRQALRELPLLLGGGACGLNLGFHLHPRTSLVTIDRFASRCRELLPAQGADFEFTDTERLDGKTGSVDVLVILGDGRTGS